MHVSVRVHTDGAITWQYVNQMAFEKAFDSLTVINITSGNGALEIYKSDKTAHIIFTIYVIDNINNVYYWAQRWFQFMFLVADDHLQHIFSLWVCWCFINSIHQHWFISISLKVAGLWDFGVFVMMDHRAVARGLESEWMRRIRCSYRTQDCDFVLKFLPCKRCII